MKIVAYHATNHELKTLDYDLLVRSRTNHENGALGLWCGIQNDWIKGFGSNIYKVQVEGNFIDWSIIQLAGYNHQRYSQEDYTKLREELLKQGFDGIRIIESSGSCDMIIVLNFKKAEIELLVI